MFYLNDHLTVKKGEVIRGNISLGPNEVNERDLNVAIDYEFEGELTGGKVVESYKYKMC